MQAAMLLVYFSNNAWNTMYNISALMVVPAYITTTLYISKLCLTNQYSKYAKTGKTLAVIGGILGALFCLFILYASEIQYVMLIPLLLTIGLPVFIWAQKEKKDNAPIFEKFEYIYLGILIAVDILIIILFMNGVVTL